DSVVLIDHGRASATGTPAQLKARIGDHRVDVTTATAAAADALAAELRGRFSLTVDAQRRVVSIPAPRQVADLSLVAEAVAATGLAVDEVALRPPTLDDAFLALTGHPADDQEKPSDDRMEARV